jgi:hypothetical protein
MARPKLHLHLQKGALHRDLGIASSKPIPMSALMKAKHSSSPLTRKRASLAMAMRSWHH